MEKLKLLLKNNRTIIKLIWNTDKLRFLYIFLGGFTGLPSLLINVIAVKYIIDFLSQGIEFQMTISIIISTFFAVLIAIFTDNILRIYLIPISDRKIIDALNQIVLRKATSFDLHDCEKYDYYDLFTKSVYESENRAIAIINSISTVFRSLINIAMILTVIIILDPIIILISLTSFSVTFILNISIKKLRFSLQQNRVLSDRQIGYIKRVIAEPQYHKEIRLFNFWPFLQNKYLKFANILLSTIKKYSKKLLLNTNIQNLLQSTVTMSTMLFLSYKIYIGQLTIGDFSALMSASQQLAFSVGGLIAQITDFYEHSLFIENLNKFLSTKSKIENNYYVDSSINNIADIKDTQSVSIKLPANKILSSFEKIIFKNVSFEYDKFALKDINLTISCGEKIAIVGQNGAGKTTLLKLLSRLYDVSSGEIYIDNEKITDIDVNSYRQLFGFVLQDYQYYAFSIAENILMREMTENYDAESVKIALDKVGLSDKILEFENGIETNLTKEFDPSGVILSGGEFQKLAIARAIARNAPILLCDEPSSALDPLAEDEILQKIFFGFHDKTIVVVSHRLSSIQHVNKIIVMDNGQIKEVGDHNTLMKQKGLYYKMFTAQASKYDINL